MTTQTPMSFTRRNDGPGNTVYAAHINELQMAIERLSLGTLPRWKSGRWYSMQATMPVGSFGGTQLLVANKIYATPLWVPPGSGAIDRVGVPVSTAVAASSARIMAHDVGTDGHPADLIADFGTVATTGTGDLTITVSLTLPAGLCWLTIVPSHAITVHTFAVSNPGLLGNSSQAGSDGSPNRANGGMTAPNPFGTSSITYLNGAYLRLAVRAL